MRPRIVELDPSETEEDKVENAFGTAVSKRAMDSDVSPNDGGGEAMTSIIRLLKT